MSERVFDPLRLDIQTFAKESAELAGRWPLRQFERVAPSLHPEAPPADGDAVEWSARGEQRAARGSGPQTWMHLLAHARLRLECQRCLQPVETVLNVDRWYHFVPGEDAAAALDAESEDEVLAMTRALDLRELVEDELLLELPIVPRHDVCPAPLRQEPEDVQAELEKPNPFAALAVLKRGGSLN
jgi:uncharacterized protein